jgi:two-component system LytT family sensor kinase
MHRLSTPLLNVAQGSHDAPPVPARAAWRMIAGVLFWTGIGVLFAVPTLGVVPAWGEDLLVSLANWWAWGMLAPLIIGVDRRLPFGGAPSLPRVALHLVLGIVAGLLHTYLRALLGAMLGVMPWSKMGDMHLLTRNTGEALLWSMLVYGLIMGSWWAHRSHQLRTAAELRAARIERSYTEARLNTLRLQLDPHFLFNTLNTISAQVEADPRLARQMIEHLGDLLRLSLDPKSRDEITLADELDFLDLYLAIQKIRFGDKLRVSLHIAPEVRLAAVPSMLIQPLVENAIRHGISRRAAGGAITIAADCRDGMLEIRIRDDGIGLAPDWASQPQGGLGLKLTRERIGGFHPDGATHVAIANHPDGGALVVLRMPLRLLEVAHAAA